MSKYRGPRCRRARRVGCDLSLTSGLRALDSKCKLGTPPGMHGAKRTRVSDYGRNLSEKQAICWHYGILDSKLYRYHEEAIKRRNKLRHGVREKYNLLGFLERRLAHVVFRMGFAATPAEARQLVVHRAIQVNDLLVDKPSYLLKPGDQISIRDRSKAQTRIHAAIELAKQKPEVDWIQVDMDRLQGTIIRLPESHECPASFQPNQVLEFYSK